MAATSRRCFEDTGPLMRWRGDKNRVGARSGPLQQLPAPSLWLDRAGSKSHHGRAVSAARCLTSWRQDSGEVAEDGPWRQFPPEKTCLNTTFACRTPAGHGVHRSDSIFPSRGTLPHPPAADAAGYEAVAPLGLGVVGALHRRVDLAHPQPIYEFSRRPSSAEKTCAYDKSKPTDTA